MFAAWLVTSDAFSHASDSPLLKVPIRSRLTSRITTIKEASCTQNLPKGVSAHFAAAGTSALKCPSLAGWQPYLVSTDERSWIDLVFGSYHWSTERKVVYESIGEFPNVGSDQLIWLKDGSGAVSVIFKITAQVPASTDHVDGYYVVSLIGDVARFCGTTGTIQEANTLAAIPERCVEELPRQSIFSGKW